MADPADLRPGQRVRLTVEGTVELHPNNSSYLILAGVMVGDYLNLMGPHQAPHTALRMAATIEVLAEPRPDEPTGRWALAEGADGSVWLRNPRWPGDGFPWGAIDRLALRRNWTDLAADGGRVVWAGEQP